MTSHDMPPISCLEKSICTSCLHNQKISTQIAPPFEAVEPFRTFAVLQPPLPK